MINEKYAKRFCKDCISEIENYDKAVNDTTQTWHCHHRTEIWWNCSKQDLIDNDCYYHRKALELIFLTPAEHHRIHHKGKYVTPETREKMGNAQRGKVLSDDTRRKIAYANKGKIFSEEHRKHMSESHKGKHFSEAHCRHISEAQKGKSCPWAAEVGKAYTGMTWKVIDGKRVWLPKE